ncbi:zinc finger protein 19-like [Vespa crabro]|uniref:zinc finger protein 19-like n=1 Tax=Vespa crabro TaxID=7445 RepID=UPI001F017D62|nr:zinc finger protein 19-like [Vespa crabro]XP_046814437.1 zinc finger protein 19-like [Vespa crabro]XP_046814438.1 zinc finger protein 19-like [Vespa crabro]
MGQDKIKSPPKILDETLNFTKSDSIQNISTKSEQSDKKYVCKHTGCNAAYFKQSRLDRHIRLHTGERPYKCDYPECIKAYTNSSHLKRHMEVHNPTKKRLQCSKCSLMISNYHNLKRHYTRVHNNDNILTCNECNAVFSKKHQLVQHIAVHFDVTSYKCSKCNKGYLNIKRLKRHETMHEKGQKSYPCQIVQCSEVFDKWALLCKHKKTHHINDYKCDQCEKAFSTKTRLKIHSKIHEKSRILIPCPYEDCERSYLFESNLKNHIKTCHLGQRFICDICKAGLSSKQKLIEHKRIHESKTKKRIPKQSQRKKRKDAGIPRKSMVTTLAGIVFTHQVEKELLERETNIVDDSCIDAS